MAICQFSYFAPESLSEILALLSRYREKASILAGGTDLLMKIRRGMLSPMALVDIKRIKGLETITWNRKGGLTIGATALLADVASHPDILAHYPSIAYAAGQTANTQIRNMGTVVGNICNAAPSADNASMLLVLGAQVVLLSEKEERVIPLEDFFQGPGVTVRRPDEILTKILVPTPPPRSGKSYQHISERGKVDIPAVAVGAMMVMEGARCVEAKVALAAVSPVPMRALETEALLRGRRITPSLIAKAGDKASQEARPISDVRASADYRRRMVAVLTKRAVRDAMEKAWKGSKRGGASR